MIEAKGLSQRIREIAKEKYISPAIKAGKSTVSLRVRDLMEDLRKEGISPDQKTPQFCTAIQKPGFLRENGLEIVEVDGPPLKLSTTVIVHYRLLADNGRTANIGVPARTPETPADKAFRLTEKLRGLLKDEIAAHGGTEGFMRWVRSDDGEAA